MMILVPYWSHYGSMSRFQVSNHHTYRQNTCSYAPVEISWVPSLRFEASFLGDFWKCLIAVAETVQPVAHME